MNTDIADLLRSMPDLEPPASSWQRIATQHARSGRAMWVGRFAMAASIIIAIVVGALYLQRPEPIVQPIMVSAPAVSAPAVLARTNRSAVRATDARVLLLQQRSQYMERLLRDLPPRSRLARADAAGVIAELEDRIAAVDYQLNRVGFDRADVGRRQSARQRGGLSLTGGRVDERNQTPALWQRRVDFMDQLVRARYSEASFDGF